MASSTASSTDIDSIPKNITYTHIVQELEKFKVKQADLDGQLDKLLYNRNELEQNIIHIHKSIEQTVKITDMTKLIDNKVDNASIIASHISNKVRELDNAQSRLNNILNRIEYSVDAKSAIEKIQVNFNNKNYEIVAADFNRLLHKNKILASNDPSIKQLIALESQFKDLLRTELKLVKDNKKQFLICKLFSQIELYYEGAFNYCNIIQSALHDDLIKNALLLESQVSGSKIPFLDLVTTLLDRFTALLSAQRPNIERTFGFNPVITLLQVIQKECDIALCPLYDRFITDRKISTTVSTVQILNRSQEKTKDEIDPLKLDSLLDEIAFLIREGELFDRDLRQMAKDIPTRYASESEELIKKEASILLDIKAGSSGDSLLHISKWNHVVQALTGHYIVLEEYYMIENIKKAIEMNEHVIIDDDAPLVTSMVDDVFYLLKKCSERSFSTGNVNLGCAMLNHLNTILSCEYKNAMEKCVRMLYNNELLPSGRKMTISLILNNYETSFKNSVYLKEQLKVGFEELCSLRPEELQMLNHCLDEVTRSSSYFSKTLDSFFEKIAKVGCIGSGPYAEIVNSKVKAQLDNWNSLIYDMTEAEYATLRSTQGNSDAVLQGLYNELDDIIIPFSKSLSETNFDSFCQSLIGHLAKKIEELILAKKFTFWGALQLDQDMRSCLSFFSTKSGRSVREKFARISQICSLISIEKIGHVEGYWLDVNRDVWKFKTDEIRKILELRVDFLPSQIKQLKL